MSDEIADGKVFVTPRDRLPSEDDDAKRIVGAFNEAIRRGCDFVLFPGNYKIGEAVLFGRSQVRE